MTNPADTAIANLIEKLAEKASRISTRADEQQKLIDQIAQLRASMEPTIVQQIKSL